MKFKLPKIDTKRLFSKPVIIFVVGLVAFLIGYHPSFESVERRLLDFSFTIRGPETPHEDIVIIAISDESLATMGSWPWPRSFHAAILQVLHKYGAKSIFLDMIFSEESKKDDDIAISHILGEAGNVVLPYYFPQVNHYEFYPEQQGLPIPIIRENVAKLGYVNVFPDSDGRLREIPLVWKTEEETFFNASVAMSSIYLDWDENKMREFADRFEKRKRDIINFPGPFENFTILPYEQVIQMHMTPGYENILKSFEGKIVLVGHTAAGTAMDLKPTVFSPVYPGVAVQASAVDTILQNKFIHRIPQWAMLLIYWIFASLVLMMVTRLSPVRGLIYSLAVLVVTFFSVVIIFIYLRVWVPAYSLYLMTSAFYIGATIVQFLKVQLEKEIINRELGLASNIQRNLLPAEMPEIPNIDIFASSDPAKHVGGDLYDVLHLKDAKWGVCVGDVSGKGVPAALYMAKALSEFRREAESETTSEVIAGLNDKLAEAGVGGLFLTMLYIILDTENSKFSFSNGGHEPILHYVKKTGKVELRMTDEGLPLGIAAGSDFDSKEVTWEPGDIIVLQSDGVKEAMNPKREIFDFPRAMKAIEEAADKSAEEIVAHLKVRIAEFVSGAPQHDDTTIMCLKHL